eukprot:c20545_g1_i1.p1 GENE.c20545_g1_i1~~c20545_g1_i1.p1  ORF type:complete len:407 (-),score=88.40 c20545_g1_i1:77-1276(-)
MITHLLRERRLGLCSAKVVKQIVESIRVDNIALNADCTVDSAHQGPVNSIDLDNTEHRYLLSGGDDANAYIYDTQSPINGLCGPILSIPQAHKKRITGVRWFANDTGMFFTGAYDNRVIVWDTNTGKSVIRFGHEALVEAIAVSRVPASQALVAAALSDSTIRMCDLRVGVSVRCFSGHTQGALCVEWSSSNEFQFASGSRDGTIRMWDVRRANTLVCFDRNRVKGDANNNAVSRSRSLENPSDSASSQFRSHDGCVSSIAFSVGDGGLHLFSLGTDKHVIMWDAVGGLKLPIHFPQINNRHRGSCQMAVASYGKLIAVPDKHHVSMLSWQTGTIEKTLKCHLLPTNACVFNHATQELYTAASDHHIALWSANQRHSICPQDAPPQPPPAAQPIDDWDD